MKAIVLAGGFGTRLRPVTGALPKPLAPLVGRPILEHILLLLKKHGFGHADVTLWYKPDDVQACFGAGRRGVSLSYVVEDIPVGTAGSVLLAAPEAKDTVLVLSGDGLTSADLTAAIAFHRQRKAAATLILQHVDIPLPYGVVVTDPDGRIRRFIEKPAVLSLCLTAAAACEGQSVVKMNTMTSGSVKLDAAAWWLAKVADGTADWAQAKAFATGELGIAESELPDAIDTYAKRMAAATAFKNKMDVLVQQQQRDVVDLQTMVNRRDVAYSTSSNIVNALGTSQDGNAANF